jgi:hypothetical protein
MEDDLFNLGRRLVALSRVGEYRFLTPAGNNQ